MIRNVSWAANQQISEETCDIENWSNDAENSVLITEINLKINSHRTVILNCNIFHNITVLLYFWSNKYSLGEQKRLLSKPFINRTKSKLLKETRMWKNRAGSWEIVKREWMGCVDQENMTWCVKQDWWWRTGWKVFIELVWISEHFPCVIQSQRWNVNTIKSSKAQQELL